MKEIIFGKIQLNGLIYLVFEIRKPGMLEYLRYC